MNEDRRQILGMLAEGKVSADEAERLIAALETSRAPAFAEPDAGPAAGRPKYLRVVVDDNDQDEGPTKVNIRVPMQLLRAGVKLGALIPASARDHINAAMAKEGVAFDINTIKPENLEELVEQLNGLTVDVDSERAKVRIFCE
jgi:hypothetical protein